MTAPTNLKARAAHIAAKCDTAFSADRYASWPSVAAMLLKRGYKEAEAIEIMESKWTRWAADHSNARYGRVPAKALAIFLDELSRQSPLRLPSDQDKLSRYA